MNDPHATGSCAACGQDRYGCRFADVDDALKPEGCLAKPAHATPDRAAKYPHPDAIPVWRQNNDSRDPHATSHRVAVMCCTKFRHDSLEHAEKAAAKLRARDVRRHGKSSVRIYECPECGGYHLTSKGGS